MFLCQEKIYLRKSSATTYTLITVAIETSMNGIVHSLPNISGNQAPCLLYVSHRNVPVIYWFLHLLTALKHCTKFLIKAVTLKNFCNVLNHLQPFSSLISALSTVINMLHDSMLSFSFISAMHSSGMVISCYNIMTGSIPLFHASIVSYPILEVKFYETPCWQDCLCLGSSTLSTHKNRRASLSCSQTYTIRKAFSISANSATL